ncbi:SRPBCC family protein [Salinispora arenicola]|uniref:Activator of Hsp90 ATPase 1 family protein n=1 Tax=Salinispora arenicola (strain CNS-205) TaxID=391037 RepID=A8M0H0_SALAI|nr:SRPBCC domain-containing protein [Salinispora arenicola]NIL58088.1 SRPBCC domain-containing protein [Salinispora arenicola]NIL62982.1 SRPBCC domain-containing protein [Salinispora arenicola]
MSSADATDATEDLVISRVIHAPVEQVWRAWSESDYVMRWWGPRQFTCPSAEMDFREGGTSLVAMRAPMEFGGGDTYNTWTYQRIVPSREIEYVLEFADKTGVKVDPAEVGMPPDMPAAMRNLVVLEDLGDGRTEVTITEFDWPVGQLREMSRMGMQQCFDKMAEIFEK